MAKMGGRNHPQKPWGAGWAIPEGHGVVEPLLDWLQGVAETTYLVWLTKCDEGIKLVFTYKLSTICDTNWNLSKKKKKEVKT